MTLYLSLYVFLFVFFVSLIPPVALSLLLPLSLSKVSTVSLHTRSLSSLVSLRGAPKEGPCRPPKGPFKASYTLLGLDAGAPYRTLIISHRNMLGAPGELWGPLGGSKGPWATLGAPGGL